VQSIAELQPHRLNLGTEINLLAHFSPTEFEEFAALYQQAYQLVKQISPETEVGYSLQYQVFLAENQLDVVETLGPRDYLGLTTYPIWQLDEGLITSVDELDASYYNRIRDWYPDDQIIFTEVGWPAAGGSDEQMQEAFILALPELMSGVNPTELYLFQLHDVATYDIDDLSEAARDNFESSGVDVEQLYERLNHMGLHDIDGVPRSAWFAAFALDFDSL
jgi:hypothetical protein